VADFHPFIPRMLNRYMTFRRRDARGLKMLVASGDVVRLTGIPHKTLCRWVEAGFVRATKTAKGSGYHHVFTDHDVLAIALTVDLRRRGFSVKQASNVCRWLLDHPIGDLRSAWKQGRMLLLVVGDCDPFSRLLSRRQVFENPAIDLEAAFAIGVPVAVIDVQEAFRQIVAKLPPVMAKGDVPCPA